MTLHTKILKFLILFASYFVFISHSLMAQDWKQLGPWGGNVTGMAGDTNLLIAGSSITSSYALFGSRDGGNTWNVMPSTVDKLLPDFLLNIGTKIFWRNPSGQAFYSLDTGNTFQANLFGHTPICKTSAGVYISLLNNSYQSSNGINFEFDPLVDVSKSVIGCVGNQLFGVKINTALGDLDSLFVSSNNARTWQFKAKLNLPLFYFNITTDNQFGKPWFYAMTPNILFVRNPDPNQNVSPLLKSIDGGTTWTNTLNGLPNTARSSNPYTFTSSGIIFTANSTGVFRSIDLGESWEAVNIPVPGTQITCMYSWKNRIFIGTQNSGIFKSDNLGDDWSVSLSGYQRDEITGAAGSGGNLFAINNQGRNYSSEDGGVNWQNRGLSFNYFEPELQYKNKDTLIFNARISNRRKTVYTVNQGNSFVENSPIDNSSYDHFGVSVHNNVLYRIETSFNGIDYFKHVLRTTNFGTSWDTVNRHIDLCFSCFKLKSSGSKLYLVGSSNNNTSILNGFRSVTNGQIWETMPTPPGLIGQEFKDMAVKGDSIFIITSNTSNVAYRSYNRGQTWTSLFQVGGASGSNLIKIIENKGALYLSSANGIFRSLNWGSTWVSLNGNIPFSMPNQFPDMFFKGDSLVVSVAGYGLWFTSTCSANASAAQINPCEGSNLQLLAAGGGTYAWTGPNNFNSTLQNPLLQNISNAATGIYTVNVTTSGGCILQRSVTIAVQPGAGNLTLSTPPVCTGGTLSLNVTGGNGTYQWSGPRGFSSTIQNPVRDSVSLADTGLYVVTVRATNGCTSNASVRVNIPNLPKTRLAQPTFNNPCLGDSITLLALVQPAAASIQWLRNGLVIPGATQPSYKTFESGNYRYLLRQGACQSQFYDSVVLEYRNLRNPRKPILSVNPPPTQCLQQFTIESTALGTYIRTWSREGQTITGQTGASLSDNIQGTYQLKVDSFGCVAVSNPIIIVQSGGQGFTGPTIKVTTVERIPGDTLRAVVKWERLNPVNPSIRHIVILRQGTVAGRFDSIGVATNSPIDSQFVDLTSDPQRQPHFYQIQIRANCSSGGTYLTPPSIIHRTIHLQLSRPPVGNVYNLIWTAYQGMTVSTYKIYRGTTADAPNLIATVAGNITTYSDVPPTVGIYYYRVEAESNDVYFPWGRIAAAERTAKSNTRPSLDAPRETINITTESVIFAATGIKVYPNPHQQSFFIETSEAIDRQNYQLSDATGRQYHLPSTMQSDLKTEVFTNQLPEGLYFLRLNLPQGMKVIKVWKQ